MRLITEYFLFHKKEDWREDQKTQDGKSAKVKKGAEVEYQQRLRSICSI